MMDIIKYDPFRNFMPTRRFNSWFFGPSVFRRLNEDSDFFAPKVDVMEEDDEYIVKAELPGVSKEDIKVEIENGTLKLSAEHKEEKEEKKDNYHLKERRWGTFYRSFILPKGTDTDKIEAKVKDGILTLTIPKAEEVKPKQIEVKVH